MLAERFYRKVGAEHRKQRKDYVRTDKSRETCNGIHQYCREHAAEGVRRKLRRSRGVVASRYIAAVDGEVTRGNRMKEQKQHVHGERQEQRGAHLYLYALLKRKPYAETCQKKYDKESIMIE